MEKVSLERAENIFLHTITKIPENFGIKHLQYSKVNISKETKKSSKKRYSTNFRSSHTYEFQKQSYGRALQKRNICEQLLSKFLCCDISN